MTQLYRHEGNGTPLQYSCLENPTDGGAWWAAVHGVAKSRTRLSDFTFTFPFHALEKEMATHSCSCLENPREGGAWWAAVYGVAQSRTQWKRLSSSSSRWLIGWTLSYSLLWLAESESLLCVDQLSPSLYISLIIWTLAYILPWLADSYLVFFSDWLTPIR